MNAPIPCPKCGSFCGDVGPECDQRGGVLAVLARHVEMTEYDVKVGEQPDEALADIREARDAVAELIAAVKNEREVWDNEGKHPGWIERVYVAKKRTDAAIARIGGGP